jgi:dolichol-phosphate mannosyltransferase
MSTAKNQVERNLWSGTFGQQDRHALLSVLTPAYNEEDNLPVLYERLSQALVHLNIDWEWIVVDDHSSDGTFAALTEISTRDPRVHALRFARNFGSHTALACALHHARGDCAVIMAADLQDPPEEIAELLEKWQRGARVVWAVRGEREGEPKSRIAFARFYYWLMRRVVGVKEMPPSGSDFFMLDRRVLDAYAKFSETNVSLMALIAWMGYSQDSIVYNKKSRLHGKSGWNLEKKLKLVVDSVTSFSYLPIRLISYAGFVVALLGFIYAGWIVYNAVAGSPAAGWSSLMVVVLVVAGVQMVMMGVLGEYLWRALDESRQRPRYLIEATTPGNRTDQIR